METLIDFSTITPVGGHVGGFTQPWGHFPEWGKRHGRLHKPETPDEGIRVLAPTSIPYVDDVEVVALTQAFHVTSYLRPVGSNRTLLARVSGSGPSRRGVVVDVLTSNDRLLIRVREVSGGMVSLLGQETFGTWSRSHADHLMRVKFKLQGSTVRAKAWMDAEREPNNWGISTTTTVLSEGMVGVGAEGRACQEYVWMGVSTGQGSAPQGGVGAYPKSEANFQGLIPLIESMCWPLYGDGTEPDPRCFTHVSTDVDYATPGYRAARARAIEIMVKNRLPTPPPGDIPLGYSHCSRFSGTVILNTIDPLYAAEMTQLQNEYMEDYRNGWVQVGSGESYDPSWCQPGDVWVSRDPGHVFVWVGEYGGYPDVIAEAAYNGIQPERRSRVGCLRRFYLDGDGEDHNGRPYSAWRFVGRQPNQMFMQGFDGVARVDAFMQTAEGLAPHSF